MSNQKTSAILLTVMTLPVIAAGFFFLGSSPLFGVLLVVLGVVFLLWLWKPWKLIGKA